MAALETQQGSRVRELKWNAPHYYDRPDGEDLYGKLSYTLKHATGAGALLGVLYMHYPPAQKTLAGKLLRLGRCTVPSATAALTFTCVTFYSTVLRKKDDEINYVLGGAAAGALLGPTVGVAIGEWSVIGAMMGALSGYIKKHLKMQNINLIGKFYRTSPSSYIQRKMDMSLVPVRQGNWTKDP